MELFKKDLTNETTEESRKKVILQWAIPVIILIVVLIVIVSNFFVISKNEAKNTIYDRLMMQSENAAADVEGVVEAATSAAWAYGNVVADSENIVNKHMLWYARELKVSQPDCYLVIVADNEGNGYTSNGTQVDISELDYFSISRHQQYFKTDNDGVTGSEAYVFAVPYYKNNISKGNIYMFLSPTFLKEILPVYDYDMKASFGICDSKGKFLGAFGEETIFFENNQYIENLRSAKLIDMSFARITTRLGKQVSFAFAAEYKGEKKTIVSVPLGINDWQYITVLNQGYVDKLVSNGWANIRAMTLSLGLIALAFVVVIVAITLFNRIQYNQRNHELALKADMDLLTELNNKIATERKISEYIATHPDSQCLFFLFDIDNFKKINDTLGHAFGDEVLRSLGLQLRNEFRVTDIIGRTGGDEFILFLKDLNTDEVLAKEAKRLENLFAQFKAGEYVKYSATASIGATVYPRDAKDYQGLYKSADKALYEAKRRGKNCLVFYNKDLKEVDTERKKETPIESDMR